MPGPAPKKDRRGHAPLAFPTTALPIAGRKGRAPTPPSHLTLDAAGKAWWQWAWHTPQAAAWNTGYLTTIARRAQLEDIWVTQVKDGTATAAMATALRQLDDTLGLTAAGMQQRRWEIVPDPITTESVDDSAEKDAVAQRRAAREARIAAAS